MYKEIIDRIKQNQGIKFDVANSTCELKNYTIQHSPMDSLGDIIFTDNDSFIYRGIKKESVNKFIELYETGILQTFMEYDFIPKFKISNYKLENYPLILEIEKLRVVYPYFWSFSMLKAEAILKLQIIEILEHFGYGLIDGHTSNSAFKEGNPVFFDFGSFVKGIDSTFAKLEIIRYNIIPLILMSIKNSYFPRYVLLGDCPANILPKVLFEKSFEVKNAIKKFRTIKNFELLKKVMKPKKITSCAVEKLFDFKEIYKNEKTLWGDYYGEKLPERKTSGRFEHVINKINKYCSNSKTFLDLAGNRGYLSYWVRNNTHITNVTSSDYDTFAIEDGIRIFKNEGINFYLLNPMYPLIDVKRFKSDVVCAMAVTHHLLLTQKIDIDFMLEMFKNYVGKFFFVEFCPLGMYSDESPDQKPKVPDFYTTEWFEEHFKKYFELIDKETINSVNIEGTEYPHRVLFVGKIKN